MFSLATNAVTLSMDEKLGTQCCKQMSPYWPLFLSSYNSVQFIIQGKHALFHSLACSQNKIQTPCYLLHSLNMIGNLPKQSDFNSCPSFLSVEFPVFSQEYSSPLIDLHMAGAPSLFCSLRKCLLPQGDFASTLF